MSNDRLNRRLRDIPVPQANDARDGAVAEARAEIAAREGSAPVRGEGRRRALALAAAAALLAIVGLLTPPGRSASAWVGELVGIGEVGGEPTNSYRGFGVEGTAVVIDNGTGPGGQRYEWVAYECEVDLRDEGTDTRFVGIGVSLEWPEVKGYGGGGGCEERQGRPPTPGDAIGSHGAHIVPSEFKGVDEPNLMVSGETGSDVYDVKVLYQKPDGTTRELPVDFARVDGELRELANRPQAMGLFVAFLPGDEAARDEVEQRLDLRALMDTGKLKLGPIARRERELAQAARERCDPFEPAPADFPTDADRETVERLMKPLNECHKREMPPSPFVYVAYDAEGREIGRFNEPLVTAMIQRPGDIEPAGRERPGDERIEWSDVNRTGGDPVRIMRGRAPEGALYEIVVARPKGSGMLCTTTWWPYVEDVFAASPCDEHFPPENAYGGKQPAEVAARPSGFLTPVPQATAHWLLSGYARPSVSRVRVIYEGRDGERHDAPVKLRQVSGRLAERIGAREPAGFWLAFVPRRAGRPTGTTVEVIAYDENGKILSRLDHRA
jgi:hypothetical protein